MKIFSQFSSKKFIALHSNFMPMIHLELIVSNKMLRLSYIFFQYRQKSFQHLLKRLHCSVELFLHIYKKNQMNTFASVYFWILSSVSLSYAFIPSLIQHWLYYCNFTVSLKIGCMLFWSFILIFWSCFSHSNSLAIPYKFRNQLGILAGFSVLFRLDNYYHTMFKFTDFFPLSLFHFAIISI